MPDQIACKYEWCDSESRTAGYCHAHYRQHNLGEIMRPARGSRYFWELHLNAEREKQCSKCKYWLPLAEFHARNDAGLTHREYGRAHCRRCNILRRMSMTARDFDEMLADQGGGCAVCGRKENSTPSRQFAVDHDHNCCPGGRSCGKCVRGITCDDCNVMIGRAHDDLEVLHKAGMYLAKFASSCPVK